MRTTVPSVGIAFGLIATGLGAVLLAASFMPSIWPVAVSDHEGANEQSLQLHGRLDIRLYDEFGNLKDERHFDNMIVDVGYRSVADRIFGIDGITAGEFRHIAIGTGTATPAAGNTALVNELVREQDTTIDYNTSTKVATVSVEFGPGEGTGSISESGMFDASSSGNMLARQTFATITKGTSDTLTTTWTITLSSS